MWIFLFIVSVVVNLVLGYVVFNLVRKIEVFEDFFDGMNVSLGNVMANMTNIDSSGAFQHDDEVGVVFQALKHTIDTLEQFVVRESDGQKEERIGGSR